MSRGALLIDLDGTLVDTLPDLAQAVNRLRQDLDRPALATATVRTMVGDGVAKAGRPGLGRRWAQTR